MQVDEVEEAVISDSVVVVVVGVVVDDDGDGLKREVSFF